MTPRATSRSRCPCRSRCPTGSSSTGASIQGSASAAISGSARTSSGFGSCVHASASTGASGSTGASVQGSTHGSFYRYEGLAMLLDAFALGGLAVWRFVLTFLESSMTGFVTPSGEILHVLDKLAPYWLGHTGISLVLLLTTVAGYLWLKTRSALASALTVIIPIALAIWFWIARARGG